MQFIPISDSFSYIPQPFYYFAYICLFSCLFFGDYIFYELNHCVCTSPGPSCSKLTTSLVNDSLKFTSSDTRIC